MTHDLLFRVRRDIDRAWVVSFDIFDTLLLRPYLHPVDLFLHMERVYGVPGFAASRRNAEPAAIRAHKREVDIDEIYDQMPAEFSHMRDLELTFEARVLTPNPEIKKIYDYAIAAGKDVIIASDMYLPKSFLADVLRDKGFGKYKKFYLSNDLKRRKDRGDMYDHIIADLGVKPSDIWHIGDNKKSDYKRAKKHGLRAVHYPMVVKQYLKNDARAREFKKIYNRSIGGSVLLAMMAWRWQKKHLGIIASDYWADFGYGYMGPVNYGFARYVARTASAANLAHVLFVARDGYTMQKMFDAFGTGIKSDYVYAPRIVNRMARLDLSKKDRDNDIHSIVEYYAGKDDRVAKLLKGQKPTRATAMEFMDKNFVLIKELADVEFGKYKNYLSKIVRHDNRVGMVDGLTMSFSSQKLIESTLDGGARVHGIYWTVLNPGLSGRFSHDCYLDPRGKSDTDLLTSQTLFLEFVMNAPEYPIVGIDAAGRPIYSSAGKYYEDIKCRLYPDMYAGAMAFAADVAAIFGGGDIFIDGETVVKYAECFIQNPTRVDIKRFQNIYWGIDGAHTKYVPLLSMRVRPVDFLKHPFKSVKKMKKTVWRTFPQTLAICLFDPIKIVMRIPKRIEVILFPKLRNRYITLALTLTKNSAFRFIIGKWRD